MVKMNLISNLEHQKNTSKFTVVFIHGNSQDSNFWNNQLQDTLFENYHCVALDLPGHGSSPKIANYQIPNLVPILVNTLNEIGPCVVIAHSLGGHLAIQALPKITHCLGLMLIGTPPVKKPLNIEKVFASDERMALLFKDSLSKEEAQQFINFVGCSNNRNMAEQALQQTDTKFRVDIGVSVAQGELRDEVELLNTIEFPVALVVGQNDATIKPNYLSGLVLPTLWKNRVHYISNTEHAPHLESPKQFNPILADFLLELSS